MEFERPDPVLEMYYVYILKSLKDSRTYVGFTNNFDQRFQQHNLGRVKSTKNLPLSYYLQKSFQQYMKPKSENFITNLVLAEEN